MVCSSTNLRTVSFTSTIHASNLVQIFIFFRTTFTQFNFLLSYNTRSKLSNNNLEILFQGWYYQNKETVRVNLKNWGKKWKKEKTWKFQKMISFKNNWFQKTTTNTSRHLNVRQHAKNLFRTEKETWCPT